MKKFSRDKFVLPIIGAALLIGSATSAITIANAATDAQASLTQQSGRPDRTPPAAFGKITAISGSTITISGGKDNTTYTVDASNATFASDPHSTAASISSLKVGDMIAVDGTVSGTSVTATKIRAGGPHGGPGMGHGVMGTVTSVNGSTLVVTDNDGGSYTIDASSAEVRDSGATSTLSVIKVGDKVMVGGKVTTANMTATRIEDGMPAMPQNGQSQPSDQQTQQATGN